MTELEVAAVGLKEEHYRRLRPEQK